MVSQSPQSEVLQLSDFENPEVFKFEYCEIREHFFANIGWYRALLSNSSWFAYVAFREWEKVKNSPIPMEEPGPIRDAQEMFTLAAVALREFQPPADSPIW